VSKTGMGVGVGVNPDDVQRLGWVDVALNQTGQEAPHHAYSRVTTRPAMTLAEHNDLIVTLPTRAALLKRDNPRLVRRDTATGYPTAGTQDGLEPPAAAQPGQSLVAQADCGHGPADSRRKLAGVGEHSPASLAPSLFPPFSPPLAPRLAIHVVNGRDHSYRLWKFCRGL
jgi:hypothetical protein